MPFEPFSFDESVGRTEQRANRVPEGFYLLEAEGFEPTPEDYQRTTGMYVKVKILQGPDNAPGVGVGAHMRRYNALGKAEAQFGLGQVLAVFGQEAVAKQLASGKVSIPSYAALQNLAQQLSQRVAGRRAVGLIADQPGSNGKPFSSIEEFRPEGDWAILKSAMTVGGGNGAAPRPQPPTGDVEDMFKGLDEQI